MQEVAAVPVADTDSPRLGAAATMSDNLGRSKILQAGWVPGALDPESRGNRNLPPWSSSTPRAEESASRQSTLGNHEQGDRRSHASKWGPVTELCNVQFECLA